MLKRTAAALIACIPLAAPAHAQAPAGISRASAVYAPPLTDPLRPASPATGLYAVVEPSEEAQPAPPAQSGQHRVRTLVLVLGIVIAAVLVAAVYLGHHN